MRCPKCGKTIPDTASYCAYCGASPAPRLPRRALATLRTLQQRLLWLLQWLLQWPFQRLLRRRAQRAPALPPAVKPLHTRGGIIRSLRDMLDVFQSVPRVGVYHLYKGDVEFWLQQELQEHQLADHARTIRERDGDHQIGLQRFLHFVRQELGITAKKTKEIALCFRRGLEDRPVLPIWHGPQAEKVVRYLVSDTTAKPILMTGYGSFGGTYLTQWAIKKAARHLAQEMGTREGYVIAQIQASLAWQHEPADLWAQVDQWVIEVQKNTRLRWFKRQFAHVFGGLDDDPNYRLVGMARTDRTTSVAWKAPSASARIPVNLVEFGFDTGHIGSGTVDREVQKKQVLRERDKRLIRALRDLSAALPSEPVKGIRKLLMNARGIGLAYRLVLVLDKVEDVTQVRELARQLGSVRGGLRTIAVVEKDQYDTWIAYDRSLWLEKAFDVVKCPPVWGRDMVHDLCGHYFEVEQGFLGDPLFLDFVDGLSFVCRGSPGELRNELAKLDRWPRRIENEREFLVVSADSAAMQQCRVWAIIERLLRQHGDTIVEGCEKLLSPSHPAVGEQRARHLLALRRIADVILDKKGAQFSKRQLQGEIAAKSDTRRLFVDRSAAKNVCSRMVECLCSGGVLQRSQSQYKVRSDVADLDQT
jgi:hypothetical protein